MYGALIKYLPHFPLSYLIDGTACSEYQSSTYDDQRKNLLKIKYVSSKKLRFEQFKDAYLAK